MVPSHMRVRLRRRRCSLSGISMGFIEEVSPGHAWETLKTKSWPGGTPANPAALARSRSHTIICAVSDDLERIAPRESARNKARDKKARPPKMIAVNPGLKKLALHIATKRQKGKL